MLPRRPVVSFGRSDFTPKAAKGHQLTIHANTYLPKLLVAVPVNAFVLRAEDSVLAFRSISTILSFGGRAQIRLAIVQRLAINMIHAQMIGDFKHLAMHSHLSPLHPYRSQTTKRIVIGIVFGCIPFIFRQAPVIIRIDDGVSALRQRDSAEGIPIPHPTNQKHRLNQ